MLAAASWTKVEIAATLYNEETESKGTLLFVIQDPNAESVAGEWKFSSFYGLKAGETAPEVEIPEPVEPADGVLLDAATAALIKKDYGEAITTVNGTDATYGAVMTFTVTSGVEQGITHSAIRTYSYEKVYFYVYNPCAYEVRFSVHSAQQWDAQTEMLAAAGWTKVEIAATLYNEETESKGTLLFVLQDPNAESVAGEWKFSSFYGLKAGETAPEVAGKAVSLSFGVMTDTGMTNEYGKIYNISREQWYIDNNNVNTVGTLQANKLSEALPNGYEYFYFWIYNGTETEYNFHLAGDVSGTWTDSKDTFAMKVGEWTKITISAEDIALNKNGQWYVYILGGDGAGAAKDGWKISTIYAAIAE